MLDVDLLSGCFMNAIRCGFYVNPIVRHVIWGHRAVALLCRLYQSSPAAKSAARSVKDDFFPESHQLILVSSSRKSQPESQWL